jgi:CheY-like chemotaxis protein
MNNPTMQRYPDLSVLLIKDGPSGYDTLQQCLLECEVRLLVACGAEQGRVLFAEELPHLVFICQSEIQDAFSLTADLREHWGCRAHTIIVGGDNTVQHWKNASESGAAACLPDPEDRTDVSSVLQRLQHRVTTCNDTSQQLLDAFRTTQLLDALPWGVMLIGHGEQIISANRNALSLSGLSRSGDRQQLDDLFLLIYGVNRDANLLLIRTAMLGSTTWNDTVYCGQNGLILRLELLPLTPGNSQPKIFHLLTVQDISRCPTSQPYQMMLSAAAFDLLFSRQHSPGEQIKLAAAITEGILPVEETFKLGELLQGASKRISTPADLSKQRIPDYLEGSYRGHGSLLKEILAALFSWATERKGESTVTASVSLQGRDGDRYCLRFSVSVVDRRLTRNSYQRGDEAVAQQLAQTGILALKNLRGIGLATTLASLMGSALILKTVAHEGKTAHVDVWLQIMAGLPDAIPAVTSPDQGESRETIRLWDATGAPADNPVSLRVLVAEDNPLEQLNIKGLMERLGHQVILVGNGREAVEECENNHFDLILMDILMPVMDGFEAVRLIREQERLQGAHTPILALTSYSLKAVQERCAKAGMNGYLPKPVTQVKLDELVRTFFSQPSAVASALPVLNLDETINNFNGNISFLEEMLDLFSTHGYPLLDALLLQLQADNPGAGLEQGAHKLKGMAANIGAAQLAEVCSRLQEETHSHNSSVCAGYLQELKQARAALDNALKQLDWKGLKERYASQSP